jgi:threonyl-tRNA synthetase
LALVQAKIIPISDRHIPYSPELLLALKTEGSCAELDDSNDRMIAKNRHSQSTKIPYMLVVGSRELEDKTVSICLRNGGKMRSVSKEDLIKRVKQVASSKNLTALKLE